MYGKGEWKKHGVITLDGIDCVPISHEHLDHLVGRLLQICDVMGDTVQREAVKSEIKMRSRAWLNDVYREVGYKAEARKN